MPSIGRLHAADHELINVPGSVFSLEGYVSLMAVDVFCADWEQGPMKVHVSDGMAAVRYQARITFPSGKVVECWHTDTCMKHPDSWNAVWSQATQLSPDVVSMAGAKRACHDVLQQHNAAALPEGVTAVGLHQVH